MPDDPNSHELLPVVPSMHHERVGEPLNDRALSLPEPLHRVPPGGVGHIRGVLRLIDADVILQREVGDLKTNSAFQNQNAYVNIINSDLECR